MIGWFESTNYFGLDDQHFTDEIVELIEEAETEIANGQAASEHGSRARAALCYLAAFNAAKPLAEKLNEHSVWAGLAKLCLTLEEYKNLGAKTINKHDFKNQAADIYMKLFRQYRLCSYRAQLEKLHVLEPDLLDYSNRENLINRPIGTLAELSVCLKNYDILENDDEDIMIAMHTKLLGEEKDVILFCDGGEHAILFKGPYRLIICDFLHPQIREKLPIREQVLCYESATLEQSEYLAEVIRYDGTTGIANQLMKHISNI